MNATRLAVLFALTFFSGASVHGVTIPTVPVGNPGNPADTRYFVYGLGSVGYNYRIAEYEVTNAQYVEFLNAVDPNGSNMLHLYSSSMSIHVLGGIMFNTSYDNGSKYQIKPGRHNNPVVFVSWYDAVRFANWLHNGQGQGDTENGAYTVSSAIPVPRDVTRNPSAKWRLPTEDEWYKAAYHKNDGATGNYWNYPTSTNTIPYSDQPPGIDAPDPSNVANFFRDDRIANDYNDGLAVTGRATFTTGDNYLTDVGAYTLAKSPYGTFDQGGNVHEWTEEVTHRLSGGNFGLTVSHLHASDVGIPVGGRTGEDGYIGFRLIGIPEPAPVYLWALGLAAIRWWSIRRR